MHLIGEQKSSMVIVFEWHWANMRKLPLSAVQNYVLYLLRPLTSLTLDFGRPLYHQASGSTLLISQTLTIHRQALTCHLCAALSGG